VSAAASAGRVLLIEDDASLQRFVALVLEDAAVELLTVDSVDQGLAALRAGTFALVICDLMLPGQSGFDLIDTLAAEPALQGPARLAIFSAGLNAATRARLDRPQVWRLLHKPCSVATLEACVRDALAAAGAPPMAAAPAAESGVVAEYFNGNLALYRAFRASCIQQFKTDAATGERLSTEADLPRLRHVAHSLKSVLLTLGCPEASGVARQLEDACEAGDTARAQTLWPTLRDALRSLR